MSSFRTSGLKFVASMSTILWVSTGKAAWRARRDEAVILPTRIPDYCDFIGGFPMFPTTKNVLLHYHAGNEK
ncbi:hypothetical protein B0H10DRAFT_2041777 [Mycena sp. CBHHK59/15]|nr:hypothetical protein B0H10DRAFT_2041777 [Mycena sp. CBHHK59/15]